MYRLITLKQYSAALSIAIISHIFIFYDFLLVYRGSKQTRLNTQGLSSSSLMSGNKSPPSICVAHVWTIFAILTFGEIDLSAWPEISSIAQHQLKRGCSHSIWASMFPFTEHKGRNGEI